MIGRINCSMRSEKMNFEGGWVAVSEEAYYLKGGFSPSFFHKHQPPTTKLQKSSKFQKSGMIMHHGFGPEARSR